MIDLSHFTDEYHLISASIIDTKVTDPPILQSNSWWLNNPFGSRGVPIVRKYVHKNCNDDDDDSYDDNDDSYDDSDDDDESDDYDDRDDKHHECDGNDR